MIWVHRKYKAPDYLLNFLFCLHSDSESRWSDGSETKLLGLTYTKSGSVPELVAQWEEFSICTKSQAGQKKAWSWLSKNRNSSSICCPPKNGKKGAIIPLSLHLPQVGTRARQCLGARCCVQGHEPRLVSSNCGHLNRNMEMISTVKSLYFVTL